MSSDKHAVSPGVSRGQVWNRCPVSYQKVIFWSETP